jgi:hypothetical protein
MVATYFTQRLLFKVRKVFRAKMSFAFFAVFFAPLRAKKASKNIKNDR